MTSCFAVRVIELSSTECEGAFSAGQFFAIIESSSSCRIRSAPLAQLDRASGYEPEGREFESLRAHHHSQGHKNEIRSMAVVAFQVENDSRRVSQSIDAD